MGDNLEILIVSSKPISSFHYIIMTKNKILESRKISMSKPMSTKHEYEMALPKSIDTKYRIVVYALLSPNNEVVADSLTFEVMGTRDAGLDNFLNIGLSTNSTEPGTNVTISLSSSKNSVVALRGVDQSVLVLKEDSDITVKTLDDLQKSFVTVLSQHYWGGSPAFKTFEDSALVIITNGFMEKEQYYPPPIPRWNMGMMPMAMPMQSKAARLVADDAGDAPQMMAMRGAPMEEEMTSFSTVPAPRVRKDFPETWLWEEVDNTDGYFDLSKTVPDSLTSWVITGFSLSSETGIGVSLNPSLLETFRPFFITLNVPYSIIKGEVLTLQVLVHNYMSNELSVDVTFDNSEGKFQFAGEKESSTPNQMKAVKVKAAEVGSVPFVIIAKEFGTLKLNVKAVTPTAGDGLSQPLIVKPPGHKQMKNQGALLDLRSETQSISKPNLNLSASFPEGRVVGADSVRITVIGELLGSTIANLDKLLQMPCGCGEQNMLNFVPDIVILDYLSASGSLSSEIKKKAIAFLESGYQRELTYRHSDGSFSAFGQSDSSGSTWLTAFVVKSFIHAKPYITVDQQIIDAGLEFLTQQQSMEGRFKEPGRVIHSDMQGGSSSGVALCAYVLLAFLEISKKTSKYSDIIDKGIKFITESSNSNDPYETNLITYALHMANHSKKDQFFTLMEKHATQNGDQKHWEGQGSHPKEPVINNFWSPPPVRPVAVEMTSYALLTYLLRNQMSDALGIGKWLLQQRNAEGGFLSTQDTVVGLAALAEFSKLTSAKETDMKIQAKYPGGSQSFEVNKDNGMVLQEFYLPDSVRWVEFETKGKGTALAQLSWFYYVEDKPTEPAFTIDIEVESGKHSNLNLHICTAYLVVTSGTTKSSKSNMVVMEVNLPSGYAFETDSIAGIKNGKVMRYELEDADSKLNIYFEYLETTNTCVDLSANRLHKIGNPAKAFVIVYDYYDTTKKSRAFYQPPKLDTCYVCNAGDIG